MTEYPERRIIELAQAYIKALECVQDASWTRAWANEFKSPDDWSSYAADEYYSGLKLYEGR